MKAINLQYPTCWEQVDAKQLKIIATALDKKMPRNTTLIFLLCHLAGIRVVYSSKKQEGTHLFSLRKNPFRIFAIKTEIIATACNELSFILDSIGLPECPLKGVNRCLYDIPFELYYTANALFCSHAENKEPSYLLEGARLLSGKRQHRSIMGPYSLWFTGLQHYLKKEYPYIFSEGEGSQETPSPAKQLHEMLSILNNNEPQLDRQIMKADTHSVLRALDNKLRKIQQQ